MIGGATALAVSSFFFPPDPALGPGRAAQAMFVELGRALERIAVALESRDFGAAESALVDARAIDPLIRSVEEELATGREATRYTPPRRTSRLQLDRYERSIPQIDYAVRNTRVLARNVVTLVREDGDVPASLPGAVRDLSHAVWELAASYDAPSHAEPGRALAVRAATEAAAIRDARADVVLVGGQVRSVAVDLVRATELVAAEARAARRSPHRGAAARPRTPRRSPRVTAYSGAPPAAPGCAYDRPMGVVAAPHAPATGHLARRGRRSRADHAAVPEPGGLARHVLVRARRRALEAGEPRRRGRAHRVPGHAGVDRRAGRGAARSPARTTRCSSTPATCSGAERFNGHGDRNHFMVVTDATMQEWLRGARFPRPVGKLLPRPYLTVRALARALPQGADGLAVEERLLELGHATVTRRVRPAGGATRPAPRPHAAGGRGREGAAGRPLHRAATLDDARPRGQRLAVPPGPLVPAPHRLHAARATGPTCACGPRSNGSRRATRTSP